ncbi:MAG: ATP-dependent Clp protease ATP-binding subunit ClpA [Gammaproteobacteria bacterium]|nr:ATP-dependent Clp protease ATP-binding subunit ClpA [Gammaproteobacteria bacterium]
MFSENLQEAINRCYEVAREKRHQVITTEHLLRAVLTDEDAVVVLQNLNADIEALKDKLDDWIDNHTPRFEGPQSDDESAKASLAFQRVLQRAVFHVSTKTRDQSSDVKAFNVLISLFHEKDAMSVHFLKEQDIERIDVVNFVVHGRGKGTRRPRVGESGSGSRLASSSTSNPAGRGRSGEEIEDSEHAEEEEPLEAFSRNLNALAKEGHIDPLIGRNHEVSRLLQILSRRRKNNPLLVGESGVGKTAIVEGLAKRIVDGQVPEQIKDTTIYALDIGALVAGTRYRGDFEERFKGVLDRLIELDNVILFIDEIHTVIGAGSARGVVMDGSNMLKPVLTSGKIKCVGSTTYKEFRGIFEQDRALARRFLKIDVPEPSVDDTVKILKGLKSKYEDHHQIRYTEPAIKAAAELSAKYLSDRFLPDKAIDVVDEAGAAARLLPKNKRKKVIGAPDVEEIVAKIARIPSARVNVTDKAALAELEDDLKFVVFGQDEAIETLASAIRLSRAGLKEEEKPVGSFLFAGPTGVGKTEVCRQLAKIMGIELLRYDMSEYMERHTVSRLIGAPPGYVGYDQGGLLTEAVTKHPHCVLLLDEIEKAHPDVFNILLQVMDHGTLTDNNGRKADFRNVVFIMTTNAGAMDAARPSIGFSNQDHSVDALASINKIFTPEFRNRLDAIIQFNSLNMTVIKLVVEKFIDELQGRLDEKKVEIHFDQDAKDWLATNGYDEKMGARPMQRLIQEKVKRKLAEDILFGELAEGGGVAKISVKDNELIVTSESHKKRKSMESEREQEEANIEDV